MWVDHKRGPEKGRAGEREWQRESSMRKKSVQRRRRRHRCTAEGQFCRPRPTEFSQLQLHNFLFSPNDSDIGQTRLPTDYVYLYGPVHLSYRPVTLAYLQLWGLIVDGYVHHFVAYQAGSTKPTGIALVTEIGLGI